MKVALSFDDVLLVPQENSRVRSRKEPNTSVKISNKVELGIPIVSSCMNTITEAQMATAMWNLGGLGILHRYNTIQQQLNIFRDVKKTGANCAVAIAATADYLERAQIMYDNGCDIFVIDVANGHGEVCIEATAKIRKLYPFITLISGNVATGQGAAALIDAGADAIRCGIGSGSRCSTQRVSGHGLPTLTTLFDCVEHLEHYGYKNYCLLADGGIKESGDIVKAIAAGANAVILGQLLAATDEAPGQIIEDASGQKFKKYKGMSSYSAQVEWRPEKKDEIVPEGEETTLPYKGGVGKIIQQLIGGLRSGMSYSNAFTIDELQRNAKFVQITNAGLDESYPH